MLPIEILRRAMPYLVAIAAVAAILFAAYRHGVSTTNDAWQAKWDKQALELAQAKADFETQQRNLEQQRQNEIERIRNEGKAKLDQARADAAAAHADADSLRDLATQRASESDKMCGDPGATAGSKAGRTTCMVFADVFVRADKAATELAAAYDKARAAGDACQRAYDAVSAH